MVNYHKNLNIIILLYILTQVNYKFQVYNYIIYKNLGGVQMKLRQVHLDFHTSENIPGIGEKFDKKQFQNALKKGHIESITLFSKCHHGWSYHPTKANVMHPHLKFDLLKAQIEAAKEIGVNTPVYISAGFDHKYTVEHKEDLVIFEPDYEPDFSEAGYHRICLNSPYLEVLLDQITEVLNNYDSDGIFLDIVDVNRCYCKHCRKTMADRGWDINDKQKAYELAEEVFVNYGKRVRETIDAVKPGHPVFHNSGHVTSGRRHLARMNTHLELESLPTGGWGYDHFPLSASYARTLGMDFLGMTGKFHESWGEFGGYKHPNALRFEAALSVANCACVSIGDQLHPSGEMDETTYSIIGKAYSELEQLQPWLGKGDYKSDIALLSQEAVMDYYEHPDFFTIGRDFDSNIGAARMLLEGQYQFDMIDIEADFDNYKVLVLPDMVKLDDFLTQKIKKFVSNGGKVLATGYSGVDADKKHYALDFGAKYIGESEYQPDYLRPLFDASPIGQADYIIYNKSWKIELDGGEELACHIKPYFNRTSEHFCSHRHAPSSGENYGAGMVWGKDGIVIPWEIFKEYATRGPLIAKLVVHHALEKLLGDNKTIKTSLPSKGITSVIDCGTYIRNHLLYASPIKRGDGVEIVEEILPVFDIDVTVNVGDKDIKSVYTVPDMKKLDFTKDGNKVSYKLPKLENHSLVIIDTK